MALLALYVQTSPRFEYFHSGIVSNQTNKRLCNMFVIKILILFCVTLGSVLSFELDMKVQKRVDSFKKVLCSLYQSLLLRHEWCIDLMPSTSNEALQAMCLADKHPFPNQYKWLVYDQTSQLVWKHGSPVLRVTLTGYATFLSWRWFLKLNNLSTATTPFKLMIFWSMEMWLCNGLDWLDF